MICSQRLLLRNMLEWSQITILSILESFYLWTVLVHTYSDPKDPGSIVESMYSDFIIKNLWKTTMKLYCVHFVNKTPLLSLFCCFDAWSAGQTIGTVYRLDSKTLATLKFWNIWFLPGWSSKEWRVPILPLFRCPLSQDKGRSKNPGASSSVPGCPVTKFLFI